MTTFDQHDFEYLDWLINTKQPYKTNPAVFYLSRYKYNLDNKSIELYFSSTLNRIIIGEEVEVLTNSYISKLEFINAHIRVAVNKILKQMI